MAKEIVGKQSEIEKELSLRELILNLQEWIKYLISKWYIFLFAGLAGSGIGLLYAVNKKPIYVATTTFVLESGEKSGLSQYAGMAAMVGIDLGGDAGGLFQGDNILELYKSRTMLEKTLLSNVHADSQELLIDRYIEFNEFRKDWKDTPEILALNFSTNPKDLDLKVLRLRDSIISDFVQKINKSNLQVGKPDKKLSIIQVDVSSQDEIFSKAFNESLVKHVTDFYVYTKTAKSTRSINILQHKVDSVRTVMSSAIYRAANILDATPNLNQVRQSQRMAPSQQAHFSAETNKAILGQLVQNLELSKMNQLQQQPLIQVVDHPIYPLKVNVFGNIKGVFVGFFITVLLTGIVLICLRVYSKIMSLT